MPAIKLLLATLLAGFLAGLSVATQEPMAKQPSVLGERRALEKLLTDTNPEVRMAAALELAKANHAAAVPVLIDLLPVLPVGKRNEVETYLQELAGEWAPIGGPMAEDEISLRIRRGAWATWWANTDGPALKELFRKHSLTADQQEKVKQAIERLGDASFQVREQATAELVAGGRTILPMLRDALKHTDLEISSRAEKCMRRIQEGPARRLPLVALRLLALRKPPGAADSLLAYLPFAEEETLDELYAALATLASRDGKPEPALVKALSDARPTVRAAAAEALARGAFPDALPAVQKLLRDADLTVRLRAAQALASHDAQAVSVLIGLMAELPGEQAWQVHEFLAQLAGDKSPPGPEDTGESRKKASAAWAAWWKANADSTDLKRLASTHQQVFGYVVVCEQGTGKIFEFGRDKKPRWFFHGASSPVDVRVRPNNRVLVVEIGSNRVTERDMKGKLIWQKQTNGAPYNVQHLPSGHTLIATSSEIIEVDRNGKDVFTINPRQQLSGSFKDRAGRIFCRNMDGICSNVDVSGKTLGTFKTFPGPAWLDFSPTGRLVLAQNGGPKVAEYDMSGKLLAEFDVPNVTTASGLPNGNFLVACNGTGQVMELDRKGRTIWEFKCQSPFRARQR